MRREGSPLEGPPGGDEQPAVGAPGHVRDAELVPRDSLLELAVVGAPDLREVQLRVMKIFWRIKINLNNIFGFTNLPVLTLMSLSALLLASQSPLGENFTLDTA